MSSTNTNSDSDSEQVSVPSLPIGVLGTSEFSLGFELIGVRTVISTDDLTTEKRNELLYETMRRTDIGILIVEDKTIDAIPSVERMQIENAIRPVVIVLSQNSSGEGTLRQQIIRAIGIDVKMEEDEKSGQAPTSH